MVFQRKTYKVFDKIAFQNVSFFLLGRVDSTAFNQILSDQRKYLAIVLQRRYAKSDIGYIQFDWMTKRYWASTLLILKRQAYEEPRRIKNVSIKALIIHFSHWFYCVRLNSINEKKNLQPIDLIFCFSFPFYSHHMEWEGNLVKNTHNTARKSGYILYSRSQVTHTYTQKKRMRRDIVTSIHFTKWNAVA